MRRSIELIKNRSDIGAGTRGSDLGIDAIEIAAINKGSLFFKKYPFVDVQTRNDSVYEHDLNPYGKHIKQVYQQCKQVASIVEDSILKGKFPLVFSGDHSSAIGTISGIKAALPNKRLGVIWIDAHADIHSPYTTPSGNLHGMPIAAVLQEDNLLCRINEVDNHTQTYWEKLKQVGTAQAKLIAEDLVYFGVRDTEEPEDMLIERLGIKNYQVGELRTKKVEQCVKEVFDRLKNCDILYVSFDVDSMDSEKISEGTGTPVPEGFFPFEITVLLQELMRSEKVVCMEVVEVNPLLDHHGNRMAEVTFDILEKVATVIEGTA
ncbi:Arginase [Sphingobacterium spiritivorum]|uniref:Arginase n=1 Tax=Sphingobacterium spiritivorum TaxID=258 RepID=A0A380CU36_SPHSI|nr:arginase [Sphingobacterium spiritivorum]SUJ29034.1 Arginase [Sphingobacterium spiritivorum]